ncbi:Mo-dependent nitrogenase C-terminal domain-containing protein [Gloeobacter violaceus]|uniref:Gll2808 protein n=1 Tax=Gloeobacter violaceus (strain ATCC 29082 / PCC 7421) TaxID=251221 RepID=Q7NGT0_GLOVI|nr:Mo-dependent nitrogenase C-terminal domain-containing protein [Gloeobacter violaceus]BAC90749.1 gll2808 [Gloeobacter violaceus PCC 7421]
MVGAVSSIRGEEQMIAWLRGLLTVAWADGDYDETERACVQAVIAQEGLGGRSAQVLVPIEPEELSATLAADPVLSEHFLRTALMVALADGEYSQAEEQLIGRFCDALGHRCEVLSGLRTNLTGAAQAPVAPEHRPPHLDLLQPVKHWLDGVEVRDPAIARFLCRMIPSQCPFERDVPLPGGKVVHIPPMCKINPLYEQLVGLRFRALSYLADDCQEDVSPYV